MEVILCIYMFIMGAIFGSFYNVVGLRLPLGQSIVSPASHCFNCNHKLTAIELIPILSYIFLKGKCKECKEHISIVYPIFESVCGLLFVLAYLSFGLSLDLIIALTFISMLIIIVVSDFKYLIIPDSVLIVFTVILIFEIIFIKGTSAIVPALANGIMAFIFMFALKKFGDFLFKKESMGGGDIKLMFIIGMVLTFPMSVLTVFLASLIGFPISIIYLKKSKDHIIPFGPLLAVGAVIILLLQITPDFILNLYGL